MLLGGPTATLAKSMALTTDELEQTTTSRIYQNMGLILHRENARAILRRAVVSQLWVYQFLLFCCRGRQIAIWQIL